MRVIAEFHPHSKYARACSKELELPAIESTCKMKGITVMGTGDFTHPKWFAHCKEYLEPAEPGLYRIKGSTTGVRFLYSSEIACIYSKGGKVRRLHIVLLAPSQEAAGKLNTELGKIGNLAADGRPILGLDANKLAEIAFSVDENFLVIPAHAWTPWFSVFGSFSGFDSLEECFEELTPRIYAIETGLSSDPPMNWRVSALDRITLISNSDAHSLKNLGREANVFEIPEGNLSFQELSRIIRRKDHTRFKYTIEFYPEEGMYHFDGHRACNKSMAPSETARRGGICPVCKRKVTVGVLNRVEELADRPEGFKPENAIGYVKLVELDKIIAEALGIKSRSSKAVQEQYAKLVSRGRTELGILLDLSYSDISSLTSPEIVEGIKRVREGKLTIEPGYDGSYGTVKIFNDNERGTRGRAQAQLF